MGLKKGDIAIYMLHVCVCVGGGGGGIVFVSLLLVTFEMSIW